MTYFITLLIKYKQGPCPDIVHKSQILIFLGFKIKGVYQNNIRLVCICIRRGQASAMDQVGFILYKQSVEAQN